MQRSHPMYWCKRSDRCAELLATLALELRMSYLGRPILWHLHPPSSAHKANRPVEVQGMEEHILASRHQRNRLHCKATADTRDGLDKGLAAAEDKSAADRDFVGSSPKQDLAIDGSRTA